MVVSMHMGWRHVLFANWPLDPSIVRPHVPDALAVDTYDGRAWLSIVPFTNVDVRPTWVPPALGFPLPELNLRTYVSYRGQRGVYFFSLDADGVLGVVGARLLHNLPYYYARIDFEAAADRVRFVSRRRHPGARSARFRGNYRATGKPIPVEPDSLPRFLVERYRYFAETATGAINHAVVRHEPWSVYVAEVTIRENTLFQANGFAKPESDPVYYYSQGVDTIASRSRSD